MTDAILIEKIDEKTIIRFNRPELRNSLSIAVLEKLHRTID